MVLYPALNSIIGYELSKKKGWKTVQFPFHSEPNGLLNDCVYLQKVCTKELRNYTCLYKRIKWRRKCYFFLLHKKKNVTLNCDIPYSISELFNTYDWIKKLSMLKKCLTFGCLILNKFSNLELHRFKYTKGVQYIL